MQEPPLLRYRSPGHGHRRRRPRVTPSDQPPSVEGERPAVVGDRRPVAGSGRAARGDARTRADRSSTGLGTQPAESQPFPRLLDRNGLPVVLLVIGPGALDWLRFLALAMSTLVVRPRQIVDDERQ